MYLPARKGSTLVFAMAVGRWVVCANVAALDDAGLYHPEWHLSNADAGLMARLCAWYRSRSHPTTLTDASTPEHLIAAAGQCAATVAFVAGRRHDLGHVCGRVAGFRGAYMPD